MRALKICIWSINGTDGKRSATKTARRIWVVTIRREIHPHVLLTDDIGDVEIRSGDIVKGFGAPDRRQQSSTASPRLQSESCAYKDESWALSLHNSLEKYN